MPTPVIRTAQSFSELVEILKKLPEPADGCVRVYRGQTREYLDKNGDPKLLPALYRRGGQHMYDPSWLGTMTLFVAQKALSVIGVDYASAQLWAPALVQHYGPGSHYLDVTRDIEVALWFSLHKYHELWIGLKEGNDPENLDRKSVV